MALSKIQAESMNLADTYAFTGTVSGAGGMDLLQTTTVTSIVDEVVFDGYFSSDYTNYKIIASNVLMETNATKINMYFYISGARATGSVYRSSAFKIVSNSATVPAFVEQTNTEFERFAGDSLGNYTNGTNANFEVNIYEPLSTNNKKHLNVLTSAEQSGGNAYLSLASGFYNSGTSAISGIEITPSADGFVRGVFKLYGIK